MPQNQPTPHLAKAICTLALALAPTCLYADSFTQTNLVSDVPGLANTTDPNLKNPWGVSFSATSPFWVSNQASGNSTLYDGAGNINPLVVSWPLPAPLRLPFSRPGIQRQHRLPGKWRSVELHLRHSQRHACCLEFNCRHHRSSDGRHAWCCLHRPRAGYNWRYELPLRGEFDRQYPCIQFVMD